MCQEKGVLSKLSAQERMKVARQATEKVDYWNMYTENWQRSTRRRSLETKNNIYRKKFCVVCEIICEIHISNETCISTVFFASSSALHIHSAGTWMLGDVVFCFLNVMMKWCNHSAYISYNDYGTLYNKGRFVLILNYISGLQRTKMKLVTIFNPPMITKCLVTSGMLNWINWISWWAPCFKKAFQCFVSYQPSKKHIKILNTINLLVLWGTKCWNQVIKIYLEIMVGNQKEALKQIQIWMIH